MELNYDTHRDNVLVFLSMLDWRLCRDKHGVCHSDIVITFDIEVSTGFLIDGVVTEYSPLWSADYIRSLEKVSLCYIWMATLDTQVIYGRTLESYAAFLDDVEAAAPECIKYVWVHNLSYEFQFLRNVLDIEDMFARKVRKPLYFRHNTFEFRCSYNLTRLSLERWAKEKKLPVKKLVGNLKYSILRTPKTKLTPDELAYCFNDVLVIYYGLQEYLAEYGHVKDIPLTQTGTVRRDFNAYMKNEGTYRKRLDKMQFETLGEYNDAVDVFGGGLTRSNIIHTGHIVENVASRDRTSAYPWEIVSKTYPMTKFEDIEPGEIARYMGRPDEFSYLVDVELEGISSRFFNTYLSAYKCDKVINPLFDNGRLISADYVCLRCTNIDYEDILQSYTIAEKPRVLRLQYSLNGYLSPRVAEYILTLFNQKTTLRGIEDQAALYMKSKEKINSVYGMMVTKTIVGDIGYINDDWTEKKLDESVFNEKIEALRKRWYKNNTAFYHGVYIPAYARHSLWETVYEMDEDIVYMDTDSNKHINGDKHRAYFERLNNEVEKKQEEIADRLGLDVSLFRPIQPNGKKCSLGTWDDEGTYPRFKTLGVKRYAHEDAKGKLHITVSGVPKTASNLLPSLEAFEDGFTFNFAEYDTRDDIPESEKKPKMIMQYLDDQPGVVWNAGMPDEYRSTYRYGIAGYNTTYTLGLTRDYASLIRDAYMQYRMGNPNCIADIRKRGKENEKEKK